MLSNPSSELLRRGVVAAAFLAGLAFVTVQGSRGPGAAGPGRSTTALRFEDATAAAGITLRHARTDVDDRVAAIEAQITATGAAVAVCDVNGDGRLDLYAVTSAEGERNALYVNQGGGRFLDLAEQAGLADLNREGEGCSTGSVWGDYDNDGHQDVYVVKWGHGQLMHNEGDGTFRDVTEEAGLRTWINSNHANWFDYDRDGLLDLFVAGYFDERHDLWDLETSRIMHDSFEFARNGGRNRLFHNEGDGTFRDVSAEAGIEGDRWTYASAAADFDRDGWQDLYLANDYGSEELWRNLGGTGFQLVEDIGLTGESKSGMCVALGDLWNGERLAVYVTNISKRGYIFQGNNLRENLVGLGLGFAQRAAMPIVDCGWAWGATFGDLDADGWQDLVVVNGFISASEERDYWYQMSKISLATGDVVADAAQWPEFEDRSLSGFEQTRVFLNNGRKGVSFREVGLEVGLDDRLDGRAVVAADLHGEGRLDLVVANQDGPLLLYRNAGPGGAWVAFDLEGTRSPRDGYGARLELVHGDRRQLRVHTAASGFSSQNGPRIHFGLGAHSGPVDLQITWPSGLVETREGLVVGQVHRIVEGR